MNQTEAARRRPSMSSVSVLSVCGEGKEDHRCSDNDNKDGYSPQDLAV